MMGKMEKPSNSGGYENATMQVRAVSGMNDSGTCENIDTQLTQVCSGSVRAIGSTVYTEFLPPNPEAAYRFDCAARRAGDATERMKFTVLVAHLKNGTLAGFLERQMKLARPRIRVAARSLTH